MAKKSFFIVLSWSLLLMVFAVKAAAQSSRETSATSYRLRGDQWQTKGEFDRAIEDYSLALAFNLNDFDAYNNRGIARYSKGEFETAISDFNRAVALKPQTASAFYNRGLARKAAGDPNGDRKSVV